jgi:TrmH family RNA methyltransferase
MSRRLREGLSKRWRRLDLVGRLAHSALARWQHSDIPSGTHDALVHASFKDVWVETPVARVVAHVMSAALWNPERILELRNLEARRSSRSYYVEGVRFIVGASDSGATFRTLVVAPGLLRNPLGQMLARRLRSRGVPTLTLDNETYLRLSLAEEPQGIGAVLEQHWEPLERVVPEQHDCWVAPGPVRAPGNLGTLMRTCAASGATGLFIPRSDEADPFNPKSVRASMGAIFGLRLVHADPCELGRWKERFAPVVVGAIPQASVDYRRVSYRRPVVLVLGSERQGMSEEQLALCDARVRIPMAAGDSLNLAVAGSLLLYEIWNQRHPLSGRHRPGHERRR